MLVLTLGAMVCIGLAFAIGSGLGLLIYKAIDKYWLT